MSRTLAAQALLAGIAERGADAVGYAYRADGPLEVHKQQTGASALLESVVVPARRAPGARARARLHEGAPDDRREQPPRPPRRRRPGSTTGSSSTTTSSSPGTASSAQEPEMTVDSEAIFALVDAHGTEPAVLEQLVGAMAAAWIDERRARRPPPRARDRPAALDRPRPPRGALRVDAARARGRRSARSARRSARPRSRRAGCCRSSTARSSRSGAGALIGATARSACSPPSARRTRASRASSGSPRSPPRLAQRPQRVIVPSGPTRTPSSRRRSRTRYWNADQAPGCTSTMR